MLRGIFGSGGGAAIGGGGTSSPSTIPRWTGPSTLGDSALVQPSGTTRMYAASNDASTYLHLYGGNDDTLPVLATLNNTNPATATFGWGFFNRSTDGNLQLSRKASSTTWSQVVTFERSTGNVGIGTASPSTRLHVSDNSSIPVIVQSSGSTDSYLRFINTSNNLGYIGYVGTNLYLAPNNGAGNVGIGTASPNDRVEVNGNARFTRPNVASQYLQYYGDATYNALVSVSSSKTFALFADVNSAGMLLQTQAAQPIVLSTNNTERARIDSAGNLILNTANTGATIQAAGTSQGLKLPATPGNADTQTLDAYQEIGTGTPAEIALTLTCGTSGTITVNAAQSKARVTRVGNKVIGHGRIVVSSVSAPLGRLSCTLTGCPQPFTFFVCETRTNDTTGVASGNIIVGTSDTSATPIVYFDRYSPNTRNDDAAANIQAGTTIVFSFSYSV